MPSAPDGRPTDAEEQDKWLADAMNVVKQQAFFMKHSLDSNNLKEALKYSAQMLGELRTSKLSPQKYYELYMRTFDELRYLEMFFGDESRHGRSNADLYELVQHSGNILPRLYLLCTVGSVYVRSKEAPAKDVLKDLVEMSRGVQHPIRGLFLRSYLSQISKDKLPDAGSEYEGEGGSVVDAVEFVLQNFTEMNKLWVRMQHQGPLAQREKREKERRELRDLVGKNLHVLSQLEGVELEMYEAVVLPRVLEQVVNCKDAIAQFYLMDCLIQVFPDDFHLHTLESVLGACTQLQGSVDVNTVLAQLMDRLAKYAAASPQVLPEFLQVDAFGKLSATVVKLVEVQPDMPGGSMVSLHVALLEFVLKVHSDRLDFVDHVLASCVRHLSAPGATKYPKAGKQMMGLLTSPLEQYQDARVVVGLAHYAPLMAHLQLDSNKAMATVLMHSIVKNGTVIGDPDQVEQLFQLLHKVLADSEDGPTPPSPDFDLEDFAEEQNLVARLVHLLHSPDPEVQFELVRLVAAEGASEGESGLTSLKIFQFLHTTVEALAGVAAELALRLYLQCAEVSKASLLSEIMRMVVTQCAGWASQAANEGEVEDMAYEFFTQAFVLYEEDISDSKAQITALRLIIGTLQRCHVFSPDNRDTLTHKATGYSAKLLKKPEQCKAVCACTHLFWVEEPNRGLQDGDRVLLCLKRAHKIANVAAQIASSTRGSTGSVELFLEIINKYLYFFEKGLPQITPAIVQDLLDLVTAEYNRESGTHEKSVEAFYENTLKHIREQKSKEGSVGDRYNELQS